MQVGDIVFYPTKEGYIKYIIKKIIGNDLFVTSYKSKQLNWLDISDIITFDDFTKIYKNEEVFD